MESIYGEKDMMSKILLIYNDQRLSEHLKHYLAEYGYEVRLVDDADLVEEFACDYQPDLIVLDTLLQKMNGFELCQMLKHHPQLQEIPIIMTSAMYVSEEDVATGLQVGDQTYPILADRCVMKPFAPEELLRQVRYVLGEAVETPDIPTILIVDDERDIRDLLKTTLEKHGYHPVEAATGKEGLALLAAMTPDVILLDYKLPDVSGMKVLQDIRKTFPDVGVIFMTAYGDEDIAMSAIAEHVDAYIRKPFLVDAMLTAIAHTLERSRSKRERKQLIAQLRESNREIMKNYAMLDHANRRLRELDQLKSEFLANIGHELRTPLNSIIGFTELVLQGYSGPLNQEQHRQLSMVLHSGNHLLRVLNDVIEISMLNAGQMTLRPENVPLSLVVHEVLQQLRSKAAQKRLRILVNLPRSLPDCYCSHEKLKLILYNLVENAIKFSSSGDITLSAVPASSLPAEDWRRVSLRGQHLPEEQTLLVSLQDQGIGIAQENFDILFDEFRQVDGSLTREYNGTGLGLAISKKLVELYGGSIWLESQIGVGTTFYFTLPLSKRSV